MRVSGVSIGGWQGKQRSVLQLQRRTQMQCNFATFILACSVFSVQRVRVGRLRPRPVLVRPTTTFWVVIMWSFTRKKRSHRAVERLVSPSPWFWCHACFRNQNRQLAYKKNNDEREHQTSATVSTPSTPSGSEEQIPISSGCGKQDNPSRRCLGLL